MTKEEFIKQQCEVPHCLNKKAKRGADKRFRPYCRQCLYARMFFRQILIENLSWLTRYERSKFRANLSEVSEEGTESMLLEKEVLGVIKGEIKTGPITP